MAAIEKHFTLYFEIFGKKMKTTVAAENEEKAKEAVKNKIIFHKVHKTEDKYNDILDCFDGIFDVLNKK